MNALRKMFLATLALGAPLAGAGVAIKPIVCASPVAPLAQQEQRSRAPQPAPPTPATPAAAAPSPREEFLAYARVLRAGSNKYLGTAPMKAIEQKLAETGLEHRERFGLLMKLGFEKIREGDTTAAVAAVEEASGLLRAELPSIPKDGRLTEVLSSFHLMRALVYMRHAEQQNCVARHTSASCVLPIQPAGVHAEKEPARRARASFEEYLQIKPDDLGARWLVNILSMTIGEYPEGVPAPLLIPPSAFESKASVGRFVDVAPALGVNTFNLAGGVIVEDFDGDGFLDIVTSTCDPEGPLTYYRNTASGGFEDLSARSGLDQQLGGLNIVGGDYDNDGDADVLVLRGGWLFGDGRMRKSLVRNNGDGTFTDVTTASRLAEPAYPTQSAAWGDFDNDGDLDLFVGNEASGDPDNPGVPYPCQLFRNNGDGTFVDIAERAGVTNGRIAKGVAAGDYDNDGDLDIYVSNIGENRLYRNNGDGTFTDVAPKAGVIEPVGRSFATWFFDFDNDGWLDLWVGAYDASIADVAADVLGLPHHASLPRLYHNNGDGTFTDVAGRMGLHHAYRPMGANFGDLDDDGFLDIYLGTGDPDFRSLMPNVMLWNRDGKRFDDVTFSGGFGHLQKGHGIAFADLDNDGDQDIYHQLGGFFPGDKFGNVLFLNLGHAGHHLFMRLVGTRTNRSALGARIKLVVDTPRGTREIHRAVGCVSSFGGSPVLRQEIGLGDADRIRRLVIGWPGTGRRQTFSGIRLDSLVEIREGSPNVVAVPIRKETFTPAAAPSPPPA